MATDSPLAASSDLLFAVGEDGRTILARPLGSSKGWRAFTVTATLQRIGGLTVSGSALYVTDTEARAVYRIPIATGEAEVLTTGEPLQAPADIAIAGDLYVADTAANKVFRLRRAGKRLEQVVLGGETPPTGPFFLASAGNNLIVSAVNSGEILEVRLAQLPSPAQLSIIEKGTGAKGKSLPATYTDTAVERRAFPQIGRPSRVTLFKGIVYVVDDETGYIYGFSHHDPQPVRLVGLHESKLGRSHATSLLATQDGIYVLDPETREAAKHPRLVPVEVRLEMSSVPEPLASLYGYLHDRGLLPTRSVSVHFNVERTLLDNHVLVGPYVATLTPLLCKLNPGLCSRNQIRLLHEGEALIVPDLSSESYIDVREAKLDGTSTLGGTVDHLVRSSELAEWRSEKKLQELNSHVYHATKAPPTTTAGALGIRARRSGTFIVPVEYLRFLAAVPAEDLPPEPSTLGNLLRRFPVMAIRSLEERPASASTDPQEPASPESTPSWEQLKKKFQNILSVINYATPAQLPFPMYVGVAEDFIDRDNPDFTKDTDEAFAPDEELVRAVPASAGGSPGQTFKVREFEKLDHGTMVAALIGARKTQLQTAGLAPQATLFFLHSAERQNGKDILRSYLRGARIFNISAHYGRNAAIPDALLERINKHTNALFVVAAGNDWTANEDGEVCKAFTAFPACWGDMDNVLVVTGTSADGKALLPPIPPGPDGMTIPGANWNYDKVPIATPAEGFYVSGSSHSYVPARGSSFSTPMVTATAALLFGQGITDPARIKQRIIATADPIIGLESKISGGLLNVRRAISDPTHARLTKDTGDEMAVEIERAAQVVITPPSDDDQTIPLRDVLRLHHHGGGLRIVYLRDGKLRIVQGVNFPTAEASKFWYKVSGGARVKGDLVELADFVGAIWP